MEFSKLSIGCKVLYEGCEETVIDITSNSVLITRTKRTEMGINCTNWLDDRTIKNELHEVKNKQ